jgi:hypothetical protein
MATQGKVAPLEQRGTDSDTYLNFKRTYAWLESKVLLYNEEWCLLGCYAVKTSNLTSIQDNHKACLDLWNRTMGMRQQIAYSQNATKPGQNTADDHKCALVCD